MPRPISWLPRLHEIRQIVTNSMRSHYDRRDIESLFELQPRAAQKLLEMLPAITIGTARLVDREVLSGFLNEVHNTDDPAGRLQKLRLKKPGISRQRSRSLVRRDTEPASIASLPSQVQLGSGRMAICFGTIEELAEIMYRLARILQDDGEAFAAAFEPKKESLSIVVKPDDCLPMFAELATLETKAVSG